MLASANRNSILAHPIVAFGGIWTLVFLLYGLHLSEQLIYDASDFYYLYALIIFSFLAGYWYTNVLLYAVTGTPLLPATAGGRANSNESPEITAQSVWSKILLLFGIWAVITVVEIVYSGGIPILWLFTGSSKTYRDFGVPSVHGFQMSLLLACAMVSFHLFLNWRTRKYLIIPLFSLFWFILSITRNYLIGALLQMLFLSLSLRRPTAKTFVRILVGLAILVVFFGLIGDLRSGGSDLIRAVGRPTANFPDWLPSGFLWAYIYLTTPLNNLFNTIQLNPSVDEYTLVATTSQLLPSFLRNLIFTQAADQGSLVDDNLNVSTGFVGPYTDMGLAGIIFFGALIGVLSAVFWRNRQRSFFLLGYLFVAQAIILSIFYNQVLFLPYLFQLVWFWYMLRGSESAFHRQQPAQAH
jgi:oligosaccharide repeat unit polymerase